MTTIRVSSGSVPGRAVCSGRNTSRTSPRPPRKIDARGSKRNREGAAVQSRIHKLANDWAIRREVLLQGLLLLVWSIWEIDPFVFQIVLEKDGGCGMYGVSHRCIRYMSTEYMSAFWLTIAGAFYWFWWCIQAILKSRCKEFQCWKLRTRRHPTRRRA